MFESNITVKEKKDANGEPVFAISRLNKKELQTIVKGLKLLAASENDKTAMWIVCELALYAEQEGEL